MMMIPCTGLTHEHNFQFVILVEDVYLYENGYTDIVCIIYCHQFLPNTKQLTSTFLFNTRGLNTIQTMGVDMNIIKTLTSRSLRISWG